MKITLYFNNGVKREAEIITTGLIPPKIISVCGQYFEKTPITAFVVMEVNGNIEPMPIPYYQCSGAELNSIEIVRQRSSSEEVA